MTKILLFFLCVFILYVQDTAGQSYFRTSPPGTEKADRLFIEEKYREALREYQKLEASPKIMMRIGAAYIKLWDMQSAIRILREAEKKAPRDGEIKGYLAEALSWNKNFGEAAVLFREALSAPDAGVGTRLSYARLLSWMKDVDGAIEQYRLAIRQDADNLLARMGLAEMLAWKKQYDQSITAYRKVVTSTRVPEYKSAALARIGQVQVWKGDMKAAQTTWKEALQHDPDNIDALFGLGESSEWSGQYKQAKAYYERILQVQPDHKSAKAKLVQLLWVK
jgi:tetratricopeptide (TPR) repeat protein